MRRLLLSYNTGYWAHFGFGLPGVQTGIQIQIKMIVRDFHKNNSDDSTSSSDALSAVLDIKIAIDEYNSFKGSPEENQARFWLNHYGIWFDSLAPYEFAVFIGILKKSPILKQPASGRGKKRKIKTKPRMYNAPTF